MSTEPPLRQALRELGQASVLTFFDHRTGDDEISAQWELDTPAARADVSRAAAVV